jgi:hypothetical protein
MLTAFAALALVLPQVEMRTVQAVLADAGPATAGGVAAGVRLRCLIAPDGSVESCDLVAFIPDRTRAETLKKSFEHQRITPARDSEGAPIYAYLDTVVWATPGSIPRTKLPTISNTLPILELSVAKLPDDLTSPYEIGLALLIDTTGRLTACEPVKKEAAVLATVACEQLRSVEYPIVRDKKGIAVRYLLPFGARFTSAG